MSKIRKQVFTNIYNSNKWGANSSKNGDYKGTSGDGSTIEYNINNYIPFMRKYIQDNNYRSGMWRLAK